MITYLKTLHSLHGGLKASPRKERWAVVLCSAIMHIIKPKGLVLHFAKMDAKSIEEIIRESLAKRKQERETPKDGGCPCEGCIMERMERTREVHIKNEEMPHYLSVAIANEMYTAATAIREEAKKRNVKI